MCRHCDNDTSADTSISYPMMDNPYGDKGVLIYFGVTHSRHGWYLEVATNKVVNETVPLFGGHLNMLVTKPVFMVRATPHVMREASKMLVLYIILAIITGLSFVVCVSYALIKLLL